MQPVSCAPSGATVHIGDEIGFEPGSDGIELFTALKAGKTTFETASSKNGGKRRRSVYLDEGDWLNVMLDSTSGLARFQATSLRRADIVNARSFAKYSLVDVARMLQWEVEVKASIKQAFSNAIVSALSASRLRASQVDEVSDALATELRSMDPEMFRTLSSRFEGLLQSLAKELQSRRVVALEEKMRVALMLGLGEAARAAANMGYGSLGQMLDLHDPRYLRAPRPHRD